MQKILNHQSTEANFCIYLRFLHIVLDSKLTTEQRGWFSSDNFKDPPELPATTVYVLKNQQNFPNNNIGRPNIALTEYMQERFLLIDQPVEADVAAIQEQNAEEREEGDGDDEAEDEQVVTDKVDDEENVQKDQVQANEHQEEQMNEQTTEIVHPEPEEESVPMQQDDVCSARLYCNYGLRYESLCF